MPGELKSKINRLLGSWPPATIALLPWLKTQGVYQQLAFEYKRAGWIKKLGRGAYVRPGDRVDWLTGVNAMQTQLGLRIHIAGKTALELQGLGHFASAGQGNFVYLFGAPGQKLPAWFTCHNWDRKIAYKMPHLFAGDEGLALSKYQTPNFEVQVSTPERAIMELLHLVPMEQSCEEAELLMEGLGTLRPKLVQQLLATCESFKVKRLFLALAERCRHSWLKKLSVEKISLGSGKRMVVPDGVLDPKYLVTLPKIKGGG